MITFKVSKSRQCYLVLAEGEATINGIKLAERDALEVIEEDNIKIQTSNFAHVLVLEMAKG